jgi:hypothetical protein
MCDPSGYAIIDYGVSAQSATLQLDIAEFSSLLALTCSYR